MENNLKDLLIIRARQTRPKVIELFEAMEKDEKLRESFIKSPWSVLDSIGELQKGHGISQSNRLLYSILSNKQFMDWTQNYYNELVENMQSEPALEKLQLEKIYSDIISALAKFADKNLIYSLFGDYNVLENTMREKEVAGTNMPGCVVVLLWVAVLVLPVLVVVVKEPIMTRNFLGRDDLAQVVDAVTARLVEKANELKSSNILEDPASKIGTYSD